MQAMGLLYSTNNRGPWRQHKTLTLKINEDQERAEATKLPGTGHPVLERLIRLKEPRLRSQVQLLQRRVQLLRRRVQLLRRREQRLPR